MCYDWDLNLITIVFVELCKFWMCVWITYFAKNQWLNNPYGGNNWNVEALGAILVLWWELVIQEDVSFSGGREIVGRFNKANFSSSRLTDSAPEFNEVILLTG